MSKYTAMFVVNRDGVDYKVLGAEIDAKCKDGDYFYVQRGDQVFKWLRQQYRYVWEEQPWWFHVRNLTEEIFLYPTNETSSYIWDATTEQPVTNLLPGGEYVIGAYNDIGHRVSFQGNTGNWDFGDLTGVQFLTEGTRMFADCPNFNGDVSPLAPAGWKNMENMFENATSFNQDISNWDITNMRNSFEFGNFLTNASSFYQNLSRWCMHKQLKLAPYQWAAGSGIETKTAWHPKFGCKDYS